MIVIQAGHENIHENISSGLRDETGAAGEVELTVQIAQAVVDKLAAAGVTAMKVDANFNGHPRAHDDYDAFISVHYNADYREADGFDVGTENPNEDGNAEGSAKLEDALVDAYQATTSRRRQTWCQSNPNVQEYYMWQALSASTPCALIECGIADRPGNTETTAEGIFNGIMEFLGEHAPSAIAHSPVGDALTNLGQALVWCEAMKNASVLDQNTLDAIEKAIHAARKALSGE